MQCIAQELALTCYQMKHSTGTLSSGQHAVNTYHQGLGGLDARGHDGLLQLRRPPDGQEEGVTEARVIAYES